MKLQNINSAEFVPKTLFRDSDGEYEHSYFTAAFDKVVKELVQRSKSLPMNTFESFLSSTIEEQRQFLADCGVQAFYSDVTPENRAAYCSYIASHLASLSTQETLTELIKFIFDDRELSVEFRHAYEGDVELPFVYEIYVELSPESVHQIQGWVGQRLDRFIESFFPAHVSWNRGLQIVIDTDPASAFVVLSSVSAAIYSDFGLITSESPSEDIIVGVSSHVPAGTSILQSAWFWMNQFTAGSITNPYYPEKYTTNAEPTYNQQYETIPSHIISEVKIYEDVNSGVDLAFPRDISMYPGFQFKCNDYQQKPECYTQGLNELQPSMINLGVMWKCVDDVSYDLPGDLYTINGTSITWNTSHPLYNAFYGEIVMPAQSSADGLNAQPPQDEPEEITSYLYTAQYQATGMRNVVGNSYLPSAGTWVIYVPGTGDPIPYEEGKTYTITGVFNASGTDLGVAQDCEIVNNNGWCRLWYKVDGVTIKVNRITYTKT